jgi:hypothetical protein
MGNNELNQTENILVKVDSNNLIYIDPNSVVNADNQVEPRGVQHENLVMYLNLEADIVPRTILATPDSQTKGGRLISIAKGNLNFLRNQNGRDFDTSWTESFNPENSTNTAINNAASIMSGNFQNIKEQKYNNSTAQSFGIDSVNINIKGWGIPTVTINFTDVRGKTLFESPKDSPYRAFFHLPWPIFYLTIKGYYGKAIRYRLHMVSFSSKFNEDNGNFDITTTFIGSTYAYLSDIPLYGVLDAPYMYAIEKESIDNNNKNVTTKRISKSSKGYSILTNVYDELKSKNLIDRNFPVKTFPEFINYAKTNSGIAFGSAGNGSPHHLAGELIKNATGIKAVHVPYKGSGPALTDLLAGHIQFMSVEYTAVASQLAAGKLLALATLTSQRIPGINLQSVNEFGLTGIDVTAWYAIYAPAGTPSEIVNILQIAINKGINEGSAKDRLLKLNAIAIGSTPEALSKHMSQELVRWGKIVKLANIQPD